MTKVTFTKKGLFYSELRKKVDQYFETNGLRKSGDMRLYLKAILLVLFTTLAYVVLLVGNLSLPLFILLCVVLGQLLASIGFNIMHDSVHNCFSSKRSVNEVFELSLNALGGNSFLYKKKHHLHHSYTNIDGIDDDIAKSPLMRQCDSQKWLPMHRYQHIYVVLVYAISGLAWITIMDFTKYFTQKIHNKTIQRMNLSEHIIFWVSKVFYVFVYLIIPVYFLGGNMWALGFLCFNFSMGLTLAIIFQMAHVVEVAEFDHVRDEPKFIDAEWAVHQLKSTANFGTNSRFLNWFCGGLNFQVEHHLFPGISHIHYPAINKILIDHCCEFNEPYNAYPTLAAAMASHFRLMKRLGAKPETFDLKFA